MIKTCTSPYGCPTHDILGNKLNYDCNRCEYFDEVERVGSFSICRVKK